MSDWLKFLPIAIQDIEELTEPTDEVKEGETIVGVVSDGLKKMWTLCLSLKKAGELLSIESKYTKSSAEELGKIAELISKSRCLEMIFWVGAHDELHLWDSFDNCALRVGWQVVTFKKPDMPFPFRFLRGSEQQ